MSVFTTLGILTFVALIQVFLQLTPAVFMIFYHFTLGKYSKTKVSNLSLFFIVGTEIATALLFMSTYFIVQLLFLDHLDLKSSIIYWIIVGILFALGLISIFCYFRKGPGTGLFISRHTASQLLFKAENVTTNSDAFMLGALSSIHELLFTLPLYFIASLEITKFPGTSFSHAGLIIIYILIALLPLFIIHTLYVTGHNLAYIQRIRAKHKIFLKIFLGICYFLLAIAIIIFRILT